MVDTTVDSSAPEKRRAPTALKPMPMFAKALSRVAPDVAADLFAFLFTRPPRPRLPLRERECLLQAFARPLVLSSGQQVPLYEWRAKPYLPGVRDAAPQSTVLLVHGFGGRAGQLGGFAAPLVAAGHRVLSYDAPAHGAAEGNRSSLPEMMDALLQVAAQIGPLDGIVAHSNGASAVIAASARGLKAKRLALLAPMPDLDAYLHRLARKLGFSTQVALKAQNRIEARYGLSFDELQAINLISEISQPTLILQDRQDSVVPLQEVEKLAQCWASAELRLSDGLGHNRILRDPASIDKVVAYLGQETQR